jgi:hypothetical protein
MKGRIEGKRKSARVHDDNIPIQNSIITEHFNNQLTMPQPFDQMQLASQQRRKSDSFHREQQQRIENGDTVKYCL